ncbi:MAG: enoyl-CoA hydratase/isomerase family protein [Acidimicrobiia bacterium]|nr:enoyl-CoA hydratase/isomerase family protein [Acidimicrobiia bacterium]NNF08860.1 enoyl-CoA hydratase/isomerase family protein [Acidimicrobiia bacterium]NNL70957.1 enoyl-CoA hydratase/isomerase family protein [Acidimicrobiia bacterium]
MGGDLVLYDQSGGVARMTINRPDAANALNQDVRDGLFDGFRRFIDDDAALVLILTGTGERAFSAGADLKEMAATGLAVPPADYLPYLGRNLHTDKPVIAAVNGVAYAGGFFLAQMCDLVVAAEHARFAITEAKWSRGAPWAAPLPWLIPPRVALELMITAEPISARRAYEVGLVNQVVPGPELSEAAEALAGRIVANAPLAVRAAKAMVYAAAERGWSEALDEGYRIFEPVYRSADAQEGPRAFQEKRSPRWQGR